MNSSVTRQIKILIPMTGITIACGILIFGLTAFTVSAAPASVLAPEDNLEKSKEIVKSAQSEASVDQGANKSVIEASVDAGIAQTTAVDAPPRIPIEPRIDAPLKMQQSAPPRFVMDKNFELKFQEIGQGDSNLLPIVTVAPPYPERARSKGLEGYVIVEFTVDKSGNVKNPKVLEAEPVDYFELVTLSAVLTWKYKPKIENGQPVDVVGVKQRFTFSVEQKNQ
ncbi:MAG: energy transducer TonB [Gammaproteobacteria bacterium]|nr:energy transducer TonB [Gammaproteobacteria bacterium]